MKHAFEAINTLDPLKDRERLRARFKKQAPVIAEKWTQKFPDSTENHQKMTPMTQKAIIRRSGHYRSARLQQTYDWMAKLYVS